MYDVIIIGAGPAGITASVYAARKKLNLLVISRDVGGQAGWSGDIENYTGYQFISGPELVEKFEEHMRHYQIELRESEDVQDIGKDNGIIRIKTNKGSYEARSVIIASGKRSAELNVPGEKEFKNKGLTYCATCDGPLFSNKVVAVIGGGNSALDATLQLVRIAKKIYLINITPALGGDEVMREKVMASEKVSVMNSAQVTEILGDRFVSKIRVKTTDGAKDLPVEGVFVEIGLIPNSDFAKIVDKNKIGEIIVDCRNQTSVPGIFAAGDVTDVPEKQIIIAAGEGSKASLSVFRYLAQQKS